MLKTMNSQSIWVRAATLIIATCSVANVHAQSKSTKEAIDDYRGSLQDGNPADLNAARAARPYGKSPLAQKMRVWKLVISAWVPAKSRAPSRNCPGTLPIDRKSVV